MFYRMALLSVAVVSLSNSTVMADTLSTPFALNLSTASTQALLSGVTGFQAPNGTLQETLPDQEITSPFHVSISGIHLTLNYAFEPPVPMGDVNEWRIQSKDISAQVAIDSINATQTIVESVGGIQFTVQVNASCSGVTLVLPSGDAKMSAAVQLALNGGHAQLSLADFSANWTPGSWKVSSLNCQGPAGFSQLVQQSVQSELETISPFLPDIQSQIQSQLASVSSSPLSWTLAASGNSGISLTLTPAALQLDSAGEATLSGTAAFNFAGLSHSKCAAQIQGAIPAAPAPGSDSLVLPVAAIQGLIQCAYLNGSLEAYWTNQDFPAFQALLDNWLLSLFVWPDLQNFSSDSIFQFGLYPIADPSITGMASDSSGNLLFQLKAPVVAAVFTLQPQGLEHYVDFETDVSGPATVSLKNGVLSFQQKVSHLSLQTFWDALYVQQNNPDESIWTSQIANDLRGFLASPGFSYKLPSWQVPGAFTLSVSDAKLSGGNVTVSLSIQSH